MGNFIVVGEVMAYYYVVPQLTTPEGITADVPAGTSWVGSPLADGTYLVKVNTLLPAAPDVLRVLDVDLPAACQASGIDPNDVKSVWAVGGD